MLTVPGPDVPEGSAKVSPVIPSLAFRFLVAIDIEGFSQRVAAEQVKDQNDLDYALSRAAASAGLDRESWYRQPRGDGELAVLPADTNGLPLVADYPRSVANALADINGSADRRTRLRVRIAIHHGAVCEGRFGPVGKGPITVCRLVDAPILRHALIQRNDLDIALIVSVAVYDEIVQSQLGELDPKTFRRVSIRVKDSCCVGYLSSADQYGSRVSVRLSVAAPARPRWHRLSSFPARAITIASCGRWTYDVAARRTPGSLPAGR